MARAFARITFTPKVQAAQTRMGSRDAYRAAELGPAEEVELSQYEIDFIGARDSIYQGTAGENGWPYVQHRGGPIGFLKVLGPHTIGYADFSGNRQYISVGNLDGDDRISLFLMDYPAQRRLKIWGRARLVDEDTEPALVARLESPGFRARVERGVVITVEAFDWNCPKYITPRFTEHEARELVSDGERQATGSEGTAAGVEEIGSGVLKLVVTGMRQLTPRIRAYELRAPDWCDLPAVTAGAHLAVPVRLPDGSVVTRQYSLVTHPHRRDTYEIAVLHEEAGRGGSAAIHAEWRIGTRLALDHPANQFPLHEDDRPAVLIAGGIGITPISAMARELHARGNSFALHYSGSTASDMAYRSQLSIEFPEQLHLYFTRSTGGTRMDMQSILRSAPADALFYVCGPGRLIEAARSTAHELAIPPGRLQYESFE
jgi:ferredoxin-NADP reductase/predicted pyridoxine 5'-phosphate oxidase superfamily flavin-nucleotide-binding protein